MNDRQYGYGVEPEWRGMPRASAFEYVCAVDLAVPGTKGVPKKTNCLVAPVVDGQMIVTVGSLLDGSFVDVRPLTLDALCSHVEQLAKEKNTPLKWTELPREQWHEDDARTTHLERCQVASVPEKTGVYVLGADDFTRLKSLVRFDLKKDLGREGWTIEAQEGPNRYESPAAGVDR